MSNKKVTKLMDDLGFRESYQGTGYVRDAVEIALRERHAMMCKDVYPAIAAATGRSPAAIERTMRTSIRGAMNSPTWETAWREIGGTGAPTNSELVHRIARECRED